MRGDRGDCEEFSHYKCCGVLLKDEQGTYQEELGMYVRTGVYIHITDTKNVTLGWRQLGPVSSCGGSLVINAAMLR